MPAACRNSTATGSEFPTTRACNAGINESAPIKVAALEFIGGGCIIEAAERLNVHFLAISRPFRDGTPVRARGMFPYDV